jgi:hypothetical protein
VSADAPTPPAPERPVLRLVRGSADGSDVAVELAALVAVLAARSGADDAPVPKPSQWANPRNRLRQPISPSPDGWRVAGLPR